MKKFCILIALGAMFFLTACGGDSNGSVYDNSDSGNQSDEKNDSDDGDSATDTTPDNGDSQHEGTDTSDSVDDSGDTAPDNGDTSDPTDDTDSSDSVSDNDSDTTNENDIEIGDTREANCTGLPANASWNSVSSITQTWDGSEWVPSTEATFSTTSSETKCRFVCNENYSWNDSECEANTRTANCEGIPANAVWNTVSSITQTWDGEEWIPSSNGTYNTNSSSVECRFKCAENYNWNGSQCVAATREADCSGLPSGAAWNTASSITQTWSGSEWLPSETGIYNNEASSNECRFKCLANYTWNGSECAADTKTENCTGLPDNALWNTASSITQTWGGSAWLPSANGTFNETASSSECRFICKTNYTWNGVACAPDEKNAVACSGKPANAVWNTVSSITQTWSGDEWLPSNSATYNETSSTSECRFKCAQNYNWTNSECIAATQNTNCSGLPENARWNTATSITQTWNGSEWSPSATGVYSTTASTTKCRFICKENYSWNNSACVADTKKTDCTNLPENAEWNTVSNITQTWDGDEWLPSAVGSYNTNASSTDCRFKCKTNYNWNGSSCVPATHYASCTGLPAGAAWNTASSITQTWNGLEWLPGTTGVYNTEASSNECRFKCKTNYNWNGYSCVAATQNTNCSTIPTNAVWNTVSSITQTWDGDEWLPSATSVYNITASTKECRFKCNTNYNWNGSSCVAATQNTNCSGLPSNAVWNTVSSITQTWDGHDWTPSNAGTYNTTASTTECRFKCDTNYNWNGSSCIAATQNTNCLTIPANAVWNTVSSITQTWNGSDWSPNATSVYNTTASTKECRFKCAEHYSWDGTVCSADSREADCESKPANSVWNDNGANGKFTQTWSNSGWLPANYPATYNKTPATCAFVCTTGYLWNNGVCEKAPTQNASCTGLPLNATWNIVSTITQTYDGENWLPSNVGIYSTTTSTTECHFKCNNHYTWNGTLCAAATNTFECEDLPENAQWNDVESYVQTWNGEEWYPADSTAEYNEEPSSTECRFICKEHYTWDGSKCVADTQTADCNTKPANTVWNDEGAEGIFIQTWSGEEWLPATHAAIFSKTPGECVFKCTAGYVWNEIKCVTAPTQATNCTGLPANAKWNTVSSITQTWDGDDWLPTNIGVYDTNPSTTECRFKCNVNYTWNGNECAPDAKIEDCTGLPENASWNTVSQISRTWNGSTWIPSTKGTYNETPSTTQCRFICNENYSWDGSNCNPNSKISQCTGLPNDASWNTATSITQTWNGSSWQPSTNGIYSEEASETECRYKCSENYFWNGSECINPCDAAPCDSDPNSTGACTPQGLTEYTCECEANYFWSGSECINPCDAAPCDSDPNSTGGCTPEGATKYTCECEGNYFWNVDKQQCILPLCSKYSGTPCTVGNLIWSARSPSSMQYNNAESYCNNYSEGGISSGWSLPSINALRTLIQNCSSTVTGGTCGVSNSCLSSTCWIQRDCLTCSANGYGNYSKTGDSSTLLSGSSVSDQSGKVWGIDFYYANITKTTSGYVRCAHSK